MNKIEIAVTGSKEIIESEEFRDILQIDIFDVKLRSEYIRTCFDNISSGRTEYFAQIESKYLEDEFYYISRDKVEFIVYDRFKLAICEINSLIKDCISENINCSCFLGNITLRKLQRIVNKYSD